jgi:hypothetical protein
MSQTGALFAAGLLISVGAPPGTAWFNRRQNRLRAGGLLCRFALLLVGWPTQAYRHRFSVWVQRHPAFSGAGRCVSFVRVCGRLRRRAPSVASWRALAVVRPSRAPTSAQVQPSWRSSSAASLRSVASSPTNVIACRCSSRAQQARSYGRSSASVPSARRWLRRTDTRSVHGTPAARIWRRFKTDNRRSGLPRFGQDRHPPTVQPRGRSDRRPGTSSAGGGTAGTAFRRERGSRRDDHGHSSRT